MRKVVPLPTVAVAEDEAARLLDDAIDGGQAQARALAHVLRREERLPDLLADMFGDAGAGVCHLAGHIFARRHEMGCYRAGGLLGDVVGPDRERTTVRHRVARVDGEVDDHLLELVDVGQHETQLAVMRDAELHFLAQHAPQQIAEVGERFRQHMHLGLQRLLPGESEELAHEVGRTVGVLLDVHDIREGRIRRAHLGEQQVGEADDRGEHIVEVMRDARRQLAHGQQLLALGELHLKRLVLRLVNREDHRRIVFGGEPGEGEEHVPRALALHIGFDLVQASFRRECGGERLLQRVPFRRHDRRGQLRPRRTFCDRSMKAALAMRMPPSLSISAMPIGALLMKRERRGAEISARPAAAPVRLRGMTTVREGWGSPCASNSTWWMSCTGIRPPVAALGRSMLKLSVTELPDLASTPEISRAAGSPRRSDSVRFALSASERSIPSHWASVALM
jgi:hypothetical protein